MLQGWDDARPSIRKSERRRIITVAPSHDKIGIVRVYGQTVATLSAASRLECNGPMGLTMSMHPVCVGLVDLCASLPDTAPPELGVSVSVR
jgi:hypothetical protein